MFDSYAQLFLCRNAPYSCQIGEALVLQWVVTSNKLNQVSHAPATGILYLVGLFIMFILTFLFVLFCVGIIMWQRFKLLFMFSNLLYWVSRGILILPLQQLWETVFWYYWNSTILVQKGADQKTLRVNHPKLCTKIFQICDDNDKYWPP